MIVPEAQTEDISVLRLQVGAAMTNVTVRTVANSHPYQKRRVPKLILLTAKCKNCGTLAQSTATPGWEFQAWRWLIQLIIAERIGQEDCTCKAKLAEAAA